MRACVDTKMSCLSELDTLMDRVGRLCWHNFEHNRHIFLG